MEKGIDRRWMPIFANVSALREKGESASKGYWIMQMNI